MDDNTTDNTTENTEQSGDDLRKKTEDYHDLYLRAAAELENLRRRSEKQISEAHQFALSSFTLSIGEVRDCLETALQHDNDRDKMHEGLTLTLRKLVTAMEQHHITPVRPDVGAGFDPTIHSAIGTAPATNEAPPDTVNVVVQSGYMINGRIVRPASVIVSKAAEDTAADTAKDAADDKAEDAAPAATNDKESS